MNRLFVTQPLWAAGLLWVLYLAVEPYVRRFWPATIVSWSRLMARQWRDPLVGRDILFGVALGVLIRSSISAADFSARASGIRSRREGRSSASCSARATCWRTSATRCSTRS